MIIFLIVTIIATCFSLAALKSMYDNCNEKGRYDFVDIMCFIIVVCGWLLVMLSIIGGCISFYETVTQINGSR